MEVITDEIAERGAPTEGVSTLDTVRCAGCSDHRQYIVLQESVACTSYGRFPGDDRSTRTDCRQQIPLYQD